MLMLVCQDGAEGCSRPNSLREVATWKRARRSEKLASVRASTSISARASARHTPHVASTYPVLDSCHMQLTAFTPRTQPLSRHADAVQIETCSQTFLCFQASFQHKCGFIEFQPGIPIAGFFSSFFSSSSKRSRIASSVKRLTLGLAKQFQRSDNRSQPGLLACPSLQQQRVSCCTPTCTKPSQTRHPSNACRHQR
jgi:hypothetical protein